MNVRRPASVFGSVLLCTGVVLCIGSLVASGGRLHGHHGAHGTAEVPALSPRSSATPRTRDEVLALTGYACNMHCEPGNVYAGAGICPVCRMDLTEVRELPWGVRLSPNRRPAPQATRFNVRLLDPTGMEFEDTQRSILESPVRYLPQAMDQLGTLSIKNGLLTVNDTDTTGFWIIGMLHPPGRSAQRFVSRWAPSAESARAMEENWTENFDEVILRGDSELRVRCNGRPYAAGEISLIRLGLTRRGQPVSFVGDGQTPTLTLLSQDLLTELTSTPETDPESEAWGRHTNLANGRPSDTVYEVEFPEPGFYRAFVAVDGADPRIRATFVIDVKPSSNSAPSPDKPVPGDGGHHHANR